MKFPSKLRTQRGSTPQFSSMPLFSKWWILCAVSLPYFVLPGSCRRTRAADGAPSELLIFNELCAMRDEPGPCKAMKDRFFFSVDTGRCEKFEYGGCGGNANNFLTLEECRESCVVSDDKNPCHLPEAPGPCRGLVTRYFFDSGSQQCRSFYYGGCFGNANNFRSMAQCQAKCQNPVAEPTQASEVHLPLARRVQQGPVVNAESPVSEPRVQRNATNQGTKEPKPAGPCFSPVDRGTCDGAEKRFAYNPETKRCHVFSYSGCGGNDNNFMHRKECIIKCVRRRKAQGGRMIRIRKKNLDNIVNRSV